MHLPFLEQYEAFSLDTETSGLVWWRDKAFCLSISTPDGEDWFVNLRDPMGLRWAQETLPRCSGLISGHNLKFDLHMLRELGIHVPTTNLHCTCVAAALIDENLPHYNLDFIAAKYTGAGKDSNFLSDMAQLLGGKPDKSQMSRMLEAFEHPDGRPLVERYARRDTRATFNLCAWQLHELARQGIQKVMDLEMRLLPVIVDMEHRGVRVDVEGAERAIVQATDIIERRQRKLDAFAGFKVNTNSAAHLQQIFQPTPLPGGGFALEDGTFVPATAKTKAPSINKDVLAACSHPAAILVRGLKSVLKVRDTFLKGHILSNHVNGVIHASYNQTKMVDESGDDYGATSGRLSCNAPNLQQITKRDPELAAIVRALFIPDLGQRWNCRDWSQMDFRIFSHYARTPSIMAAYAANPRMDFHQLVADLTGLPRSPKAGIKGNAKALNLGLSFGMGMGRMAKEMGLPYTTEQREDKSEWFKAGPEAEEIFRKYHSSVPGVKGLLGDMTAVAKNRGFVRTGYGRIIRFPGGNKTYKAGAMIFQGTAADALKLKLIEVHALLKGTEGRLMLNVHDEFDSSLPMGAEGDRLDEAIRTSVECFDGVGCALKLDIPIRSSGAFGVNWWEASK